MPFGPNTIQQPTKLNYRNPIGDVDNAAHEVRSTEIQLINRVARIARQEREAEYNE